MARRWRKREPDLVGAASGVVALMVLAFFLIPQLGQVVLAISAVALCALGVVVTGLIGLGLFRWTSRSVELRPSSDFVIPGQTPAAPGSDVRGQPRPGSPPSSGTTAELLDQLRSIDWFQFEKIVALLYQKLGYSVTRRGGANPDGGIDLVIEMDGSRSAVQCKQWRTWNVGVKPVREFLGALTDAGVKRGIFITLGGYTGDARALAEKHGIEIVNETGLARMLELTDARFDPVALEILRDQRKFCPKCESEMVLRTAKKGLLAGGQFLGMLGVSAVPVYDGEGVRAPTGPNP
jgi:hypothetical protein